MALIASFVLRCRPVLDVPGEGAIIVFLFRPLSHPGPPSPVVPSFSPVFRCCWEVRTHVHIPNGPCLPTRVVVSCLASWRAQRASQRRVHRRYCICRLQRDLFGYYAGGDLSTVTGFPGLALARQTSTLKTPLFYTDDIKLYPPHPKGVLSPLCLWVSKPSLCQANSRMSTKGWVLFQEVSCRTFTCCDRKLRRSQLSNAYEGHRGTRIGFDKFYLGDVSSTLVVVHIFPNTSGSNPSLEYRIVE